MDIWELATKIRQEARSKRKIRINLTRSAKMYNWIQEPKGKDKEIIEKYYCGVKIIMNDGKILLENVYTLEEIYLKIDELAESLNMEKIDEYYYVPKNKTGADLKNKNQSDLGKFVYNQLGIGAKVWFIENVKEWFWLHKEDEMKIKFSNDLKDNFESLVFFILYILIIYLIGELAILFDFATLFNLPELFNLKDDSNIFDIFIFGFFYIILFIFIGLGLYIGYKICVYLKNNINIK